MEPNQHSSTPAAASGDATEGASEALLSIALLGAQVGTILTSNADLQTSLDRCAELLVATLDAVFVRIWLFNSRENVLELFVSRGKYTHLNGAYSRIPVGKFEIGLIAQERKPYLTNTVSEDDRISDPDWARREGLAAFAGYPLIVGERLEGVLALFFRKPLSKAAQLCLSSISDGIAITIERKQKEDELQALQNRNARVLEAITDAFFALDKEWRFTYVNRRFSEITGQPADFYIGKDFWREFPAAVGTAYEQHYREAVRTGKPNVFEAYYPPLNLWTEVHTYPFEEGLSIYFQDISERKRLEQKLRDAAKLESLGVMAGGIAHDFNNLLTGIMGNASLLAELTNAPDRQLAEDVVKAAERAADLTRQMLAFSGKGRFELRSVDLSSQVREILRLVRPMVDKNVVIDLNLGEELPCVEADPGQMQQLIMNLVINGAEAMEGASGRVTITTKVAEVDATFIAHMFAAHEILPGRYVCLEVQDTGCGMSDETKVKIFDPFFTTKFTGRGLGLAAVSGIVRGHKGALRIYSSLGEGTTFKVFLPAGDGQEMSGTGDLDSPGIAGRGTILLVDDEELVRRIGHTSLERRGYRVLLASNGKEAVQVFESQGSEIDLVILDMTMPVMGGAETLDALRTIRSGVPIIVSSGYNEVEVIRRFTSQGVAGFIQKPYSASTLNRKVKAVLENKGGEKT